VDLLVSLESEYCVRLTDDLLSMETFATPGGLWAALDELQKSDEYARSADPNWNG
jgi:acyl carrier protein